ncbi:hypothetical protein B0T18DRAFT_405453 [Schizothecium vesticola]|uniref:Secreted protein n=1 Tax=Schizothecium vesticola TaxID=314040 RepID=A0AA40F0M3_9PEZI|nr:hypothetical protein B0T18DRAFT_405453 [Schizothecium vesticola]
MILLMPTCLVAIPLPRGNNVIWTAPTTWLPACTGPTVTVMPSPVSQGDGWIPGTMRTRKEAAARHPPKLNIVPPG